MSFTYCFYERKCLFSVFPEKEKEGPQINWQLTTLLTKEHDFCDKRHREWGKNVCHKLIENIFSHIKNKILVSRMYNELIQIKEKTTINLIAKGAKYMNKHFIEAITTDKHENKLNFISNHWIRVRYHFILIRLTNSKTYISRRLWECK